MVAAGPQGGHGESLDRRTHRREVNPKNIHAQGQKGNVGVHVQRPEGPPSLYKPIAGWHCSDRHDRQQPRIQIDTISCKRSPVFLASSSRTHRLATTDPHSVRSPTAQRSHSDRDDIVQALASLQLIHVRKVIDRTRHHHLASVRLHRRVVVLSLHRTAHFATLVRLRR